MEYTQEYIHELVNKQKAFFKTNVTLSVKYRINALKRLKKMILNHEEELIKALHEDLGRSEGEAYLFDIASTILEINENIKGVKKWSKPERHYSGLLAFPSTKTMVYKIPYGVSLIIAPFNFPILLSLGVLTATLAAGNTAIIKTSSKSIKTTETLERLIKKTFSSEYITLLGGGHDVSDYLLDEKIDKIFYTGSPRIGRHVLEKASKNLVSTALELGAENGNWAIVRKDADIKDAARKIAFIKIANSGQICVNVNAVLIERSIAYNFIEELKKEISRQIGSDASKNEQYSKMINKRAFDNVINDLNKYHDRIIYGGTFNSETLKISPTLLYPIDIEEEVVNRELFSPLLPLVLFDDSEIDKNLSILGNREHPLSLYIFTKDMKWAKRVMSSSQYGGGGVNEVLMQTMIKGVPFNGVGHSGMGSYHGEWGFKEFSHPSTVIFGKRKFILSLKEHPYTKKKLKLFRKIIK